MNDSILNLDIALEYLNNGRTVDSITYLSEIIIKEGKQFNDIYIEPIDLFNETKSEYKDLIKNKIMEIFKNIIDIIISFIKWVKDKILDFFEKVKKIFVDNKKFNLKNILKKLKVNINESSSYIKENNSNYQKEIEEFLNSNVVNINRLLTPEKIISIFDYDVFKIANYKDLKDYLDNKHSIHIQNKVQYIGNNVPPRSKITFKEFLQKEYYEKTYLKLDDFESSVRNILDFYESKKKYFNDNIKLIEKYQDQRALYSIEKEKYDVYLEEYKDITKCIEIYKKLLCFIVDYNTIIITAHKDIIRFIMQSIKK